MKFADLHLHTAFSDGTYTPEELVAESGRQGLSCIAVVDHDTVDGVGLTIEAGLRNGVEALPGIELTAEYDGLEVHILGYLVDYRQKVLKERLDILKNNRVDRIHKMVDKLKAIGITLPAQAVFDIAKGGAVGRLHVARAMVKQGVVGNVNEAFTRYIGDRSPAYICGFRFEPKEAIRLIRSVGGIPVLAHPYQLRRDELIPEFVACGLMGLEVYYPEHTQSMVNFYLRLAQKYNLLVTGGSDCHGTAKPEVKIGSIKIHYALVENLKAAKDS